MEIGRGFCDGGVRTVHGLNLIFKVKIKMATFCENVLKVMAGSWVSDVTPVAVVIVTITDAVSCGGAPG